MQERLDELVNMAFRARAVADPEWAAKSVAAALLTDPRRRFIEEFYETCRAGYAGAWSLGAQLAGAAALGQEADHAADVYAGQDNPFILRYADELFHGDMYDPGQEHWAHTRNSLYVKRTRGAANEAFVSYSDAGSTFQWVLGSTEPCVDCPRLAANGPYFSDELAAYPGDGSTDCLANCKCQLVRSDGAVGMPDPRLDTDHPALGFD